MLFKNKKILLSVFAAVLVVGGITFFATQQKKDTTPPQESSAIGGIIAALSNNNPGFSKFANTPSSSLNVGAMTVPGNSDNGTDPGQGKFRTMCLWSHFAYDDPIVYPNQPGKSHLHMFFGNTKTDAYTTRDSLINSGGGSCQGAELNRTAYWVPALQDGKGNVKIPYDIVIYYKSKGQSQISPMPQGLVMVAGEFFGIGSHEWTCGGSGTIGTKYATIPQCGSDFLHGTITFPQCWDGKNLDSGNHKDHMYAISEDGGQRCPASHPVRFPQVQVLLYWKNPGDTTGWYLSSDRHNGANHAPGSTLHSDWWGGWNNEIMNTWTNNCVRASKDCSIGQLGTSYQLPRFAGSNLIYNLSFDGQNTLPLPAGAETTPAPPPGPNPNPNPTTPTPTPPSPSPTTTSPQATPGAQTVTQNPTAIEVNADTFTQYGDGAGNLGNGGCRPDAPNADLKATADHCDIGWFDPGDWYEYTVKAPSAGRYAFTLSYGNGETGNTGIRVSVNGSEQINKSTIPPTGAWETHQAIALGELNLNAGDNKIRLDQAGYLDIEGMTFTLQGASTTPTPPTPSPNTTTPSPAPAPTPSAANPADKYTHPTVRYVSKTGNNSNNGSASSPWLTIQHAIDNSPNDSLIRIQPGTYNENLEIQGKVKFTLVGDGSLQNKPYIIGNDYTIVHIANSSYITIDNLKIEATTPAGKEGNWGGLIGINSDSGAIGDVHHIAARNNEMIGVASSPGGFRTSNKSGAEAKVIDYLTIEDNVIRGKDGQYLAANFGGGGSGISMFELKQLDSQPGPHIIIRRNFIYRVSQVVNSTLIGSNEITDGNGIIFDGNDFNNYNARVDVYQNIVADVGATGMHAYKSKHEINYFNNTIVDYGRSKPSTAGIGMDGGAQRAWNNIIIGGSKKHPSIVGSGQTGANIGWQTAGGSHSINIDPQLQNPFDTNHSIDDFLPKASSPIGANANATFGSVASATTDFFGTSKTAAWFGAIAVGSTNTPPTPPTPTPTPPSPSPTTDPHAGHGGSTDPKAVTIRARGAQGDETMELWVNGQQQMVFNNVATTDTDYTHVMSATTTIDTIEARFTNDNGVEGAGDRMLTVDGITINGTKYETEASSTRSSGIWNEATACAEGYKQSETMACNGWVRFEAAKGIVIGGNSTTAPGCTAANPLTMNVKPDAAGKYTVWARINVRNNVSKPNLDFKVANTCVSVNVNSAVNTWTWVKLGSDIDLQNTTQDMKVFSFSDSDIWVDKVLFTFDTTCNPVGDDAQGCVVDRIEATILGITQGQVITKGAPLNVFAEVLGIKSSNPTITFSIDGKKISENIKMGESTYCLMLPVGGNCGSFDTSGLSAGSHTLSLNISDSGRVVTAARAFTVNDTGTNPTPTPTPTPPSPSPTPTPPAPTPTPSPTPTPTPPASGTVSFEAETFSEYNDNSPGNYGTGTCRSDAPNADMKPTGSGSCTIGWIDPGDWYEWNVTVPTAGNYTLTAKYANGEAVNTSVKFSVDGVLQVTNSSLAPTGSWETLQNGTMGVLTLKAGANKIRFDQTGWIDFDVFTLTPGGTPTAPTTTPSTVTVKARGFTGQENIALKVNGQTVATWNNISITMTDYSYSAKTPTVIDTIRVEYTNDENSATKNIQVDSLIIDGVTYESEAPQTYSVGSWNPTTGCDPGFKTNEYISCPGYFEYQAAKGAKLAMGTGGGSAPGGSNGSAKSTVKVRARGTSGAEKMLLKINGNTVSTFANLSTSFSDYTYTATQTTTVDTLRVHFNEDGYFNGIDKNIIIDYVEIDGVKYETEAKTVYSKGVWTRSTGCRLGFKKHDWLSCNGWVEYRDAKGVVLAKNVLGDSTDQQIEESAVNAGESITTSGGSTISLREGSTISQLLTQGRDDDETPIVEVGASNSDNDVRKVEGDINLSVSKSALDAITSETSGLINYAIDGEPVGLGSFEAPELRFDTRRLENGQRKLVASVQTSDGKVIRDFAMTLEIENDPNPVNEAKEKGAPLIVLGSNHQPKVDLRGEIILTTTPEVMDSGNGRIVYTVDGQPIGTTTSNRPEFVLNTQDLDNGTHVLGVSVFGREGAFSGYEMTVSVDNSFIHSLSVGFSNRVVRTIIALALLVGAAYVARPKFRTVFEQKAALAGERIERTSLLKGRSLAFAKIPTVGMVPAMVLFFGSVLAFAIPGVAEFSGSAGFLVEAENAIGTTSSFVTGVDANRTYVVIPKTGTTTPTPPTPPTPTPPTGGGSPIKTEAEDFTDYSDGTPGNLGTGTCRSSNAPNADMKPTGSGSCTLGWLDPGDWYEWTVTAPSAGNYTLNLTYANGEPGATSARFLVDGTQQINATTINPTGSWDTLSSADVGVLTLKAGANKIRFEQTGFIDIDFFTLTPGGTTTPTPTPTPIPDPTPNPTPTPPPPGTNASYTQNLAMIKAVTAYRNTNQDNSPYINTPSAQLPVQNLYGPRTEYLGDPAGNPEQAFPVAQGGQFRVGCEFSHFAYDDPLVYPGQPGKAHLHMFFGNTDANAYSTYNTIFNSGSATCNGMELNRTGYWAPAMFDSNGNVRIPERIVVYYKGEGLANQKAEPYPEGAAMIANQNINTINSGQGGAAGKFNFVCSEQWSGASEPASNTMPACDGNRFLNAYGVTDNPHVVLEMNVKFPQCWTGGNPADYANSYHIPREGGWYFSKCDDHTLTNLEYFINYRVNIGENTSGWYLSSDVNPQTLVKDKASGSSIHADWWGGWHRDTMNMWINNCVRFRSSEPSGCGFGYLTTGGPDGNNPRPGPALKYRKQYTGPEKVPAQTIFKDLCRTSRQYTGPSSAAYCTP